MRVTRRTWSWFYLILNYTMLVFLTNNFASLFSPRLICFTHFLYPTALFFCLLPSQFIVESTFYTETQYTFLTKWLWFIHVWIYPCMNTCSVQHITWGTQNKTLHDYSSIFPIMNKNPASICTHYHRNGT